MSNIPTWTATYHKVLDKCKAALEQGKHFIEVRPYYDHRRPANYRLYAWSEYHGYRCFAYGLHYTTVEDWARNITNSLASNGWCRFEQETGE